MSIGTAIVIVGGMFFLLAASIYAFVLFQWRRMSKERDASVEEFEERRDSIRQGARCTYHRFKL